MACSSLLGFDDYVVDAVDAAPPSEAAVTPNDGSGPGASDASCDVDLATTCYACSPATTDEFLNSCTGAQCLPFDRSRLTALLLADGGLPPLPVGGDQ
jgi:hypothetical protein